jgi:hypothetical protein
MLSQLHGLNVATLPICPHPQNLAFSPKLVYSPLSRAHYTGTLVVCKLKLGPAGQKDFSLVRPPGFEPGRPLRAADFKSAASTDSAMDANHQLYFRILCWRF